MIGKQSSHSGDRAVTGAAMGSVVGTLRQWKATLVAALDPDVPDAPASLDLASLELASLDLAGLDDAGRVEAISVLEELGCVLTAAQAALAADLDASTRAHRAAAGVPTARQGAGIAAPVALARRTSPHRGQRHLGLARIIRRELPQTWAAWRTGRIDEWKATVIARETACLELADRLAIDTALGADPDRLHTCGTRELTGWILGQAARLDPAALTARRRRAEAERHVSLRPAPDTMTWLSALLPVADGVAAYATLTRAADTARAAGDPRTRGQVMADTLTASLLSPLPAATAGGPPTGGAVGTTDPATGPVTSSATGGQTKPSVELCLVMSDQALLAGADDGAHLDGDGPIPAELAREIVCDTLDAREQVWVRRVFADPAGHLVAMESTRRLFPASMARFVRLRDQVCRTPWCDAPIRHIDHVRAYARGGPTTGQNAQGLCEACDYAKQAPGWSARSAPGIGGHEIDTTTPTGHTYRSRAPALATIRTTHITDHWVLAG